MRENGLPGESLNDLAIGSATHQGKNWLKNGRWGPTQHPGHEELDRPPNGRRAPTVACEPTEEMMMMPYIIVGFFG